MKFKSELKETLSEFINQKHALGYTYISEECKLINFDKYLYEKHPKVTFLNKEILVDFINQKEIKISSKNGYAVVLRQYAKYLVNNNYEAYVLPDKLYTKKNRFKPYIYLPEEIKTFFNTITQSYLNDKKKNNTIYLIFKILHLTGLRVSECLNLKISDIDLDNKYLLIKETKNGSDRLLPIKLELFNDIINYNDEYNKNALLTQYFFRKNNSHYNRHDIYGIFRNILFKSKIMHTENGPRVHDFRHTFAINSLIEAEKNNKVLIDYLPILRAYLGHTTVEATTYYLRLTSELYPEIRNVLNDIIPELSGDTYEK